MRCMLATGSQSFIQICYYLPYADIIHLASTCRTFYSIVIDPSFDKTSQSEVFSLHTQLWNLLCARERVPIRNPPFASSLNAKTAYDSHCVSFYLVEFSAPGARQEFYVCPTRQCVAKALHDELTNDQGRLLIQHLCRLGLDIVVYVCYQNSLINVTPWYDQILIKVGVDSILTFRYLGGIGTSPSQCSSASSGEDESSDESRQYLALNRQGERIWKTMPRKVVESARTLPVMHGRNPLDGFRVVHTFFRGGRVCRYEINHWKRVGETDKRTVSNDRISGAECPPDLFCDLIFMSLSPIVDVSSLPPLHPAGLPVTDIRRKFVVNIPIMTQSAKERQPDGSFLLDNVRSPLEYPPRRCLPCQTYNDGALYSDEQIYVRGPMSTYETGSWPHDDEANSRFEAPFGPSDDLQTTDWYVAMHLTRRSYAVNPQNLIDAGSNDTISDFVQDRHWRNHVEKSRNYKRFELGVGKNRLPPHSLASREAPNNVVIAPVVLMY